MIEYNMVTFANANSNETIGTFVLYSPSSFYSDITHLSVVPLLLALRMFSYPPFQSFIIAQKN